MDQLRAAAVAQTLFAPTTLQGALRRLGFVQADPIRSPARAQDLILRHRVGEYRAGDLERRYGSLGVEEGALYAYGFVPGATHQLLAPTAVQELSDFEARVLEVVREHGPIHPKHMRKWFGDERVTNAWGGYSKATKITLEHLHRRGLLRVARRDAGIRVYETTTMAEAVLPATERVRSLIRVVVGLLGPVPEQTLSAIAARFARRFPIGVSHRTLLRDMIEDEELSSRRVDGLTYVLLPRKRAHVEQRYVRFLAPFDPIVWDRRRFEHLWGWAYRFEAYTPLAKRVRGYYALPVLWCDAVVGWANVRPAPKPGRDIEVELGFAQSKPLGRDFNRELKSEIDRMRSFLFAQ